MKKILTLTAVLFAISACSSSSSDDPASGIGDTVANTLLNGTWLQCIAVTSTTSGGVTITLNNGTGNFSGAVYGSSNNCTGASTPVPAANLSFTYTIGEEITIAPTVDGISKVNAVDFTDTSTGITSYSIYAIKDLTKLYIGDETADPNKDETTAAKRSAVLESTPYIKQ